MNDITILVAPSGSGKSTYTIKYCNENEHTLCINRDNIRRLIVGSLDNYYERKNLHYLEQVVTNIEGSLFFEYTQSNYSIIVDNTNLKQSYIKRWIDLAKHYKYNIWFKIIECDINECKARVLERDFPGRDEMELIDYIDKQHQSFNSIVDWINKNYKNRIK